MNGIRNRCQRREVRTIVALVVGPVADIVPGRIR
jgi:hypothetical protein